MGQERVKHNAIQLNSSTNSTVNNSIDNLSQSASATQNRYRIGATVGTALHSIALLCTALHISALLLNIIIVLLIALKSDLWLTLAIPYN